MVARGKWLIAAALLLAAGGAVATILVLRGGEPEAMPGPRIRPPAGPRHGPPRATFRDQGYVGPSVCAECHEDRVAAASKTSHFRTSGDASKETVLGPIDDTAVVRSADTELRIQMIEHDGALWQVAIDRARDERFSRKMDIVIGSGKIAQTYLYWEDDRLFELPATYFLVPTPGWRYSPGYNEGEADFARPAFGQCLECHTLYAEPAQPQVKFDNQFVGQILHGITCEKCHGPGAEHASYHREHPQAEDPHGIVTPSDLTRDRRDEICLFCHAERGKELQPVFSFRPGKQLRDHYAAPEPRTEAVEPAAPEPGHEAEAALHAFNQYDRLIESACYQGSKLSCVSCHNPHAFERGDTEKFSERCVRCHSVEAMSALSQPQHAGDQGCIDCHMPVRGTQIAIVGGGTDTHVQMRDHRIAVYPPK